MPTTPERIGIDYAQLFDVIQPGSRVLISDGLIELLVEKIEGNGVQTTWSVIFEREGGGKPVCVAESIGRHYF